MPRPRVPWYAKGFAALLVAYALSPIDLIPDFIPVLGYLDELVLLPLGVLLAVKMIPAEILAEYRRIGESTRGTLFEAMAFGAPKADVLLGGTAIAAVRRLGISRAGGDRMGSWVASSKANCFSGCRRLRSGRAWRT